MAFQVTRKNTIKLNNSLISIGRNILNLAKESHRNTHKEVTVIDTKCRRFLFPLLFLLHLMPIMSTEIYNINVKEMDGESYTLEKYKGDVILVVNVASNCSLATDSYKKLVTLISSYSHLGLKVLLFPCSQFLSQEFKNDSEIKKFVQKFSKSFVIMEKTKVKGEEAHPLFKLLIKEKPGTLWSDVKWNFTSFLINRKGEVVQRFGPGSIPDPLNKDLLTSLNETV